MHNVQQACRSISCIHTSASRLIFHLCLTPITLPTHLHIHSHSVTDAGLLPETGALSSRQFTTLLPPELAQLEVAAEQPQKGHSKASSKAHGISRAKARHEPH